ncbi:MAG: tetratricopeptide repeat protein [Gammaproteobacteria bacterium]
MQFINNINFKNLILSIFIVSLTACAAQTENSGTQPTEDSLPAFVKIQTPPVTPKFKRDYIRAISLMQSNKNNSAIRALKLLTQNYPQFAGPHVNLGLIYFHAKQYSKAQKAFDKALNLNPNNAVSHNHIGVIQRKNGKFKDALKSYQLAIRSKPKYANAHLNIGILYDIYLANLSKALEHYKRYQEITGNKDKNVSKWIIDIERRVNAS